MAKRSISETIQDISDELNRVIERKWVFPASARYGELLAAGQLDPSAESSCRGFKNRVRDLLDTHQAALVSAWGHECKHITQMVRSEYGLNSEELLALLTSLSELAFVKLCLQFLGYSELHLDEPPSHTELRDFLVSQRSVYPSQWSLPHTVVLDAPEHWWWKPQQRNGG
jgi:hypothetical protein